MSILKLEIKKKVAEMKLKFTHLEDMKDDWADMDTHCVFGAATKIPFRLNQNQALLTFEDEEGRMYILIIKLMSDVFHLVAVWFSPKGILKGMGKNLVLIFYTIRSSFDSIEVLLFPLKIYFYIYYS